MHDTTKAAIVRTILALSILTSISLMYVTYVIEKDYIVFTNPTGPDDRPQ